MFPPGFLWAPLQRSVRVSGSGGGEGKPGLSPALGRALCARGCSGVPALGSAGAQVAAVCRPGLGLGERVGLSGHCGWGRVPVAGPSRLIWPLVSDWELAVCGMRGVPSELEASLFGVAAASTAIVARGHPMCRVVVGSGRLDEPVVERLWQVT